MKKPIVFLIAFACVVFCTCSISGFLTYAAGISVNPVREITHGLFDLLAMVGAARIHLNQ
jgi:hypothetical protein